MVVVAVRAVQYDKKKLRVRFVYRRGSGWAVFGLDNGLWMNGIRFHDLID